MRNDKKQHSHQLSHQTLRFVEDFAEVLRSVTHLWLEQNQKTHNFNPTAVGIYTQFGLLLHFTLEHSMAIMASDELSKNRRGL